MTGLRPLVAVFFDSGTMNWESELLNQHIGEIRHGRNQRKLQGLASNALTPNCLSLALPF